MSRIERIDNELKKQISIVLQEGVRDPRVKGFISVLRVTADTELSYAKVYVSIFGADGEEKTVIEGLNSAEGYIKSRLKSKIRLRAIPSLHFIYDDSVAYGSYISKIINDANKPKDEE